MGALLTGATPRPKTARRQLRRDFAVFHEREQMPRPGQNGGSTQHDADGPHGSRGKYNWSVPADVFSNARGNLRLGWRGFLRFLSGMHFAHP